MDSSSASPPRSPDRSRLPRDLSLRAQAALIMIRRVPLSPELLREVRQRVGRLVPYAAGSPGSFAGAVRRSSDIDGFHVDTHSRVSGWSGEEVSPRYSKYSDTRASRLHKGMRGCRMRR